jgi:TonB family protein
MTNINTFGQDTTYFDLKKTYFSKSADSVRFDKTGQYKGYPKVNYSREIIKLSKGHFKIENCYYLDNKRYTDYYETYYEFKDDSILITEDEKWVYKKLNDSLIFVYQKDADLIEVGAVTSLIPFVKHGDFITKRRNGELLFTEHYIKGKYLNTDYFKGEINGAIYSKVDVTPEFPLKYGDLTTFITKNAKYPKFSLGNSITPKIYIRFVVTLKGEVRNIELVRSSIDRFAEKEAIKVIARLPNFEPGKLNGKNVNSYYVIPVNFQLQ